MLVRKSEIYKLVKTYARKLNSVSSSPEQEIEEILFSFLNLGNRAELYLQNFKVEGPLLDRIKEIIRKREEGIPLQYLISEVNFYGLKFFIEEGVFIPRPETELLVDYVIKNFNHRNNLRIVEVGTGAGVISICLTKFLPNCKIIATDINFKAISLAKKNAFLNKCGENICFLEGDLFSFLKEEKVFDLIISNPPYIGETEYEFLQKEVKKEPTVALVGGKYGYEFSLEMVKTGSKILKRDGKIIIEIGNRQRKFYEKFLSRVFDLKFIKDFQGQDRLMIAGFKNG